jgi:hydroxyquinol 1,2-dioxygenase
MRPELPMGANICLDGKGEPMLVRGRILDTEGNPVDATKIDVWQANDEGFYDVQQKGIQPDFNLRGVFRTGADGVYTFRAVKPKFYPIPDDGPVGNCWSSSGGIPSARRICTTSSKPTGYETPDDAHLRSRRPYIHSDAVFGVKESLLADFKQVDDPEKAKEIGLEAPYWDVEFDFVLARA